jgi:O-antigen ligase
MSDEAQITSSNISAYRARRAVSPLLLRVLIVALALFVPGSAVAYLVVNGSWHIAAAFIFAIPALLILHRYPHLAVIIWLVLSPFLVQTETTMLRQIYWIIHRALPPLTLIIILVSAMLRISKREVPRPGVPEIAMAGYIIVSIFSILTQNNTPQATLILFYDQLFIPMCLYAIVRITSVGMRLMKWLIPIAIYITVTQVAIGWLSWARPHVLPNAWMDYAGSRTTGSLNSPGVYTTTLVFSGLIVLHTAMNMRHGWKRLALIGIFSSTFYAIFISYSRASWLMGILVIIGLFFIYPRLFTRISLIVLPVGLILGTTILGPHLTYAKERISSEQSNQSALGRLPVLLAAYRMFEEKPVFGWGYNNFDLFDRQFQGRVGELVNPDQKDLTSHNIFMTLLAEQGIAGTVLFILPTIWLLGRSLRRYRFLPINGWMSRKTLWLLWLVILSYFVVDNFSPMVVEFGLSLNWISLGLIAAIVYSRKVEL